MQSITNTRQIDRTDYAPFLWRRDRSNANMETPLPEKFRTMLSPLSAPPEKYALDASYQPSLQGFHSLNASGNRPHFPETDSVEALIALTKEMEEGDWLHFHCVAGKGRLTALFAVYESRGAVEGHPLPPVHAGRELHALSGRRRLEGPLLSRQGRNDAEILPVRTGESRNRLPRPMDRVARRARLRVIVSRNRNG